MSRITIDESVVNRAKRELFESIVSNVDLDEIKAICKEQHGIGNIDAIDFKNGDLVICENNIAYEINFKMSFALSILIDSAGNYIDTLSKVEDEIPTPEERIEAFGSQTATEYKNF